ncbi:MAG: hypothetical protein ACRDBG_07880 [Waterburya sp.]
MPSILPTQLFSGYAVSGGNIQIPIASLSGLAAAEADAVTGDGREVARAFVETMVSAILALPAANRPARLAVVKANPQGTGVDQVTQSYTISFNLLINQGEADLQLEPA